MFKKEILPLSHKTYKVFPLSRIKSKQPGLASASRISNSASESSNVVDTLLSLAQQATKPSEWTVSRIQYATEPAIL